MQTLAFILLIAALVQLVEMFLQKSLPALYQALGIYLPLITTNCAVLGVAILNVDNGYNFIQSVTYGAMSGVGFLLAIVIFASVRERIAFCEYPKCFDGFPHRPCNRRAALHGVHGLPGTRHIRLNPTLSERMASHVD